MKTFAETRFSDNPFARRPRHPYHHVDMETLPRHPGGRPRDPAIDVAVLRVAREALLARGLAGLTLSGVAERAGCDRRTIQLRWPTAVDLAAAAVADACPPPLVPPETRRLDEDLRWLVDAGTRFLADPDMGRLIRRMVGEFDADPRMRAAYQTTVLDPWRAAVAHAMERARSRDELRDDVDLPLLTQMLFGPIITRTLLLGTPPEPGLTEATVDLVLRGALRPGA